jgi:hypothetical protein
LWDKCFTNIVRIFYYIKLNETFYWGVCPFGHEYINIDKFNKKSNHFEIFF